MNSSEMSDQVVMITGVAGQVGRTLVNAVLDKGGKVVGLDVDKHDLEKVTDSYGWGKDDVHILEADIRKKSDVEKAFRSGLSKFGKITSQVNNAGVSVFEPWTDRKDKDIDWVMSVNLKGTFYCMKVFMEHCIDTNNEGAIVNIASHYGLISPDPKIYTDCARRNSEIYGATKAGVIQMTKYFSVNALADGAKIRVNAVAPGGIRDPWEPQGPDFQKRYGERCPMGRLGELVEIARPVLFLLSKDASYINGHTLVIDGGMTAW